MIDDISSAIAAAKSDLPNIRCRLEEPMKNHTSFKIGGPVRVMFFPKDSAELISVYDLLHECGVSPIVIGNGTNILADDRPLESIVVNTAGLGSIDRINEREIRAGAGALLSKLAVYACGCGLSGLEFAHGIPGSLGGAVTMNAGAYGGEMKDVVFKTTAFSPEKGEYTLTGTEHGFSYRNSRFSDCSDVVLFSYIMLREGGMEDIKVKMSELAALRRERQPLDQPSAGSTFKRPKEGYAAALIEQAGLKGYAVGGAMVSEKHSGFVVNRGGALFSDVMAVIEHVKETVLKQFGIELELEIKILS